MSRPRVNVRCTTCGRPESIRLEIVLRGGFIAAGWYCKGGARVCRPCQQPKPVEPTDGND